MYSVGFDQIIATSNELIKDQDIEQCGNGGGKGGKGGGSGGGGKGGDKKSGRTAKQRRADTKLAAAGPRSLANEERVYGFQVAARRSRPASATRSDMLDNARNRRNLT